MFIGEGGEITRRPLEGFPREGTGGRHSQGKETLSVLDFGHPTINLAVLVDDSVVLRLSIPFGVYL